MENGSESVQTPRHYIGIGASAGGLEAIETFFSHMGPDSGFAFIVVQHLSPDYKSLMVELLSKRTPMVVRRAEDGMAVQADEVYLIPPKKNLTIFHGKLMLSEQDAMRGLNLPIDVFFRSLAEDQGEKAVGIILSGTGSDGMRGVRAIKECGGMVMVQSEDSAKFDGMPRAAISTGLSDYVLPPEEMPAQLLSYAKHPYVTKAERSDTLLTDEDALTRIFALLREKCKVDFTYYKPSTVTRRIERRMSVNQINEIREYVSYLHHFPGEIIALYRELLIGVTRFFRDKETFEHLSEHYLPELLESRPHRELRFWVSGCSTGEEAYTLAILAREGMEKLGVSHDVKIFATDVDRDAILRAGNGLYPESIAADLSPQLLAKHFYRKDENFQISRNVREMVVFARHNLIKDPPFTNIDLISCRNLLIYLQPILQKKVLEFFNFSLNPKGILLLGSSETTGDMSDYFQPLHQKHRIYRTRGRRQQLSDGPITLSDGRVQESGRRFAAGRAGARPSDGERILERFVHTLTGDLFPLAVIVNEQLEVLHVFGDTEGFFKLPSGRIINDISKMAAKDLAIPLTTGIQRAFREGKELRYSNIRLYRHDRSQKVRMRIKPLPEKKGQVPLVAVFLEESEDRAEASEVEYPAYDLSQDAEQRIQDLEQELQFTKENLQATIEELETANEELQATNEELLASNQELQSTNEQLQSANEELHTVNAEYQNKIMELTELHNDVDNLLTSSQIGKMLLDENLEIRKFSPQIARIFKIADHDVGRPIHHLSHYLKNADPVAVIQTVQQKEETREQEVWTHDGHWYLMRVVPYHIGPGIFSGTVLTFIDITQVKNTQQALRQSEAQLKETARLARVGSWRYCPRTQTHYWSEETFRIHELEPGRQPEPEEGIDYYAPWARPVIRRAFQNACEHGEPYDLVLEIITAKGNRRWVRAIGRPEMENGKVTRVSGAFQDISDMKQAEAALRESEAQIRSILQAAPIGIGLVRDREIVQVNEQVCRMIGRPREELLGEDSRILYPTEAEYAYVGEEKYRQIRQKGMGTVETQWAHKDGRVFSVLMSSVPLDPQNLAEGVTFTAVDISEQKAMQEALKQREEQYRTLFETMAQGAVYQDPDGNITDANPAAQKILGSSLDQMQGRTSMDPGWKAVHPDGSDFPGDQHPSMRALETGKPVDYVVMGVFNPQKEKTRWINVSAVPLFRPGENSPYQVYATFEDITERIEAEAELIRTRERLDLAFSVAGLAWWDWEPKTGRMAVSPKMAELIGYSPEAVEPERAFWVQRIHPEDQKRIASALESYLSDPTGQYAVDYRLKHENGDDVHVFDQGRIVETDENGEPVRLIGTVRPFQTRGRQAAGERS